MKVTCESQHFAVKQDHVSNCIKGTGAGARFKFVSKLQGSEQEKSSSDLKVIEGMKLGCGSGNVDQRIMYPIMRC